MVGPFEDFGTEQVVTFPCGGCDEQHNIGDYRSTGLGFKGEDGAFYPIETCPNGKRVYLKYDLILLGKDADPIYSAIESLPVPEHINTHRR